jgi:hypothetical protein
MNFLCRCNNITQYEFSLEKTTVFIISFALNPNTLHANMDKGISRKNFLGMKNMEFFQEYVGDSPRNFA